MVTGSTHLVLIIAWMDEDTRSVLARRHVLAVGLALVALVFLVMAMLIVLNALGWGYDFEAYFRAALRVTRGDVLYESWMLDGPFPPGMYGYYLYPPPFAVGVVPFTALSLPTATIAWFLLRVALLGLACAVMPVRPTIRLLVFAVGAFSHPVLVDLALGNVSILVLVALAFTWRGLDRPMGSIAAALAMSVRPTLGILVVWWFVRRRWRAILVTLIAGGVLIALTLPVVGTRAYNDYFTMLRNVSQVTGVTKNVDLASTALRLNLDPLVATAALYGGYLIAVGAMIKSLRHDRDLSFMVTVSATLLLTPLLWDHYFVSLLLPAAFLAQRGRTWGLGLPLLGWLPPPLLPVVAIIGTLVPFLAERRPGIDPAALEPGAWRRPWLRRRPPSGSPRLRRSPSRRLSSRRRRAPRTRPRRPAEPRLRRCCPRAAPPPRRRPSRAAPDPAMAAGRGGSRRPGGGRSRRAQPRTARRWGSA